MWIFGKTTLHGFHMSPCHTSRGTVVILDYLFRYVCIDCIYYWSNKSACLLPLTKDSGSLNSWFLSCEIQPTVCSGTIWPSWCHHMGVRIQTTGAKYLLILWLLLVGSVVNCFLFLTQKLHVFCQHP